MSKNLFPNNLRNRLLVIRHAEMKDTSDKVCQSWVNTLPTVEGLIKKSRQINSSKFTNIGYVFSSNLPRSVETAKTICTHLNIKLLTMHEFRGQNFGYYINKDVDLIKKTQPELFDNKGRFKFQVKLKKGESLYDLEQRIAAGLKIISKLVKNDKKKILLITHRGVITMLHKIYYHQTYYNFWPEVEKNSYTKIFYF